MFQFSFRISTLTLISKSPSYLSRVSCVSRVYIASSSSCGFDPVRSIFCGVSGSGVRRDGAHVALPLLRQSGFADGRAARRALLKTAAALQPALP